MQHLVRSPRPRSRVAACLFAAMVVAGGALVGPRAVAATFPDVGPAHPFHDEVQAMAHAGITTGFSDGRYRPDDPVTRQSMAAFLQRGLGRISFGSGEAVLASSSGEHEVASASIRAGGADGRGSGFLLVTAATSAVDMGVGDGGAHLSTIIDGPGGQDSHLGFLQLPVSQGGDTASNQVVIPVTGGQQVSISVRAEVLSNGVADVIVQSSVVVQFVPFGGTGGV